MENFTEIFKIATRNIKPVYFQLPVAGQENPIYRERVYCYELYHQLRLIWPENCEYSLCGELDKRGHPLIRGNGLDHRKPDFLVHKPGDMDENYLVIEVKSTNAKYGDIEKDIQTLTAFRRYGEYVRAIYLIYGNSLSFFQKIKSSSKFMSNQVAGTSIDLELIELWYHSDANEEAHFVEW